VFRGLGLPAAVLLPHRRERPPANEYCVLDNLIGDAKVFALAALGLAR